MYKIPSFVRIMLLASVCLFNTRAIVVGAFRPALGGVQSSNKRLAFRQSNSAFLNSSARYLSSTESSGEDSSNTPGGGTVDNDNDDKFAEYRNKNNRNDQVFSALSGDGGIKVTAATARNLLNDMMMKHTMTETPTEALGRTMVCALLMSNGIQAEQVVQISMNGDGPIRGIVAISSGTGGVRGYVGSPMLGSMPLKDAVGKGSVQIVKNHPDWPRPYNGITSIRHGDIDRDIGIYLAESEQRSCVLAAATSVTGVLCTAAGGYLIEQLPGVEQETIDKIEQNLARLVEMDGGDKLPTNLLSNGMSPLDIVEIILDGLDMAPLQQITPSAVCDCSEDRLFRSLRLLPKEDIADILEKEEMVEARCQFCGTVYRMGGDDLRTRLEEATGDPSKDSDNDYK